MNCLFFFLSFSSSLARLVIHVFCIKKTGSAQCVMARNGLREYARYSWDALTPSACCPLQDPNLFSHRNVICSSDACERRANDDHKMWWGTKHPLSGEEENRFCNCDTMRRYTELADVCGRKSIKSSLRFGRWSLKLTRLEKALALEGGECCCVEAMNFSDSESFQREKFKRKTIFFPEGLEVYGRRNRF